MKAVIFDMDGVIVDTEPYLYGTYNDYLKTLGKELTSTDYHALFGCSDKKEIEILSHYLDLSDEEISKFIKEHGKAHPFPYPSLVMDGVREVIKFLKSKKILLAIASSSNPSLIKQMLETCDLEKYFDLYVSGYNFKESKPDPAIYNYVVEKLGLAKEDCLIIEDSKYGMEAALNAKIDVVLIKNEVDFDRTKALKVFNNHFELLNYLKEII